MHSASGCNGHQRPPQPEDRNSTSYNFRNRASGDLSLEFRMATGVGKSLVQSADSSSSVAVPIWIFQDAEEETGGYDRRRGFSLCIGCNAVSGNQRIYSVSDFVLRPDSSCMVDVGHQGKAKQGDPTCDWDGYLPWSSNSL